MKKILFIFFIAIFSGCNDTVKKGDINETINKLMMENNYQSSLILFVSEKMCSECINKELINIQNNREIIENLVIIGVFPHERYFYSFVNRLKPVNTLYIKSSEINISTVNNVFYCVYDSKTKSISTIFYPDPCDEEKTCQYYETVKTEYKFSKEKNQ
jgi:hypothetical protein